MRLFRTMLSGVVLFALLLLPVFGASWAGEDFSVQVPEGFYIVTAENNLADPIWEKAGVKDPAKILELFHEDESSFFQVLSGENREQMNGIACFLGDAGKTQIMVTRSQTTDSMSIYNLSDMEESEWGAYLEKFQAREEDEKMKSVGERYDVGETPFVRVRFDGENDAGEELHELVYMTLLNGDSVTLNVFAMGEEIPDSAVTQIQEIADSFRVTNKLDRGDTAMSTWDWVKVIGTLVLLVAVVLGSILHMRHAAKKDKELKARMGERLAAYRKENSEREVKGRLCYANVTKCSDEVLRSFSIYQAYLKPLASLVVTFVSCAVLLVLLMTTGSDWMMIGVLLLLIAYVVFKTVTASSNVLKVQKKIYTRGSSDMAKYAFYEECFRVSGIQSVAAYPYFQITDVRSYKDYIYLYYGPENVYIVSKQGFANQADPEAFVKFIREKRQEGLDGKTK